MGEAERSNVLVIDDQPELCDVLHDALGLEGFPVITASSIEAALDVLKDTTVAAIVSDCFGMDPTVPDLTAIRVLRHAAPDTPIILCTGRSWAMGLDPLANDLFAIVPKPFDLAHLFAAVRAAANQPPAGQSG
jgi:DNA-binding NtrC family response regulator